MAVWEYLPGREVAEVVVMMRNVKGALATVAQSVAALDINVLSGFVTAPGAAKSGTWSFFADVTDAKATLPEVGEKLRQLSVVESVEFATSRGGFMVDEQHFPVRWGGRRALIFRTEALTEMISHLWNVFGSGAAAIIDQMAEAMGRYSAKEMAADFGREFLLSSLGEVLQTYSALGYADVEIELGKTPEAPTVVRAKELFECEANAQARVRHASIFFRGHLRGFMSAAFDSNFEVSEVECVALGDDSCSFQIARVESVMPTIPTRN